MYDMCSEYNIGISKLFCSKLYLIAGPRLIKLTHVDCFKIEIKK